MTRVYCRRQMQRFGLLCFIVAKCSRRCGPLDDKIRIERVTQMKKKRYAMLLLLLSKRHQTHSRSVPSSTLKRTALVI